MLKPDSLIFDMDGTLWDASETYTAAWNAGFKAMQINKTISRSDLDYMMGWERRRVLEHTFPDYPEEKKEQIYDAIVAAQDKLLPQTGGRLYEGVSAGIAQLATKYKLFILSNCPVNTINQFLTYTGLTPYITDQMAHGVNNMPKHHNIKLLQEKYALQNPVYVGDTEPDQVQSDLAGVPFVFVEYGFGQTEKYALKFSHFTQLTTYFMAL
ncbi:HAD family hydrolase [Adhaeribacter rhizoryzae]|uniref:phosphoglycolate phosphatase n=1 Tax=Adhaeribacter rhizoryzae TaxID=2607907 RepID=A0A5M6D647_9BACT|nr:HAD family hydrolase [Adhaeribacter rhizoryzae]KAA5541289.1 HAD family hydrolase [Adhaeribacter rhizoryzae]